MLQFSENIFENGMSNFINYSTMNQLNRQHTRVEQRDEEEPAADALLAERVGEGRGPEIPARIGLSSGRRRANFTGLFLGCIEADF